MEPTGVPAPGVVPNPVPLMNLDLARYCILKRSIQGVSAKFRDRLSEISTRMASLRAHLLRLLDDQCVDRQPVGLIGSVQVCVRRIVRETTRRITNATACDSWDAVYRWDVLQPLIGPGKLDLPTAVGTAMQAHLKRTLVKKREYADVIKCGTKDDVADSLSPPREVASTPAAVLEVAHELWKLKDEKAALAKSRKVEVDALKSELQQLEHTVHATLDMSFGESHHVELSGSNAVFLRKKYSVTSPPVPLRRIPETMVPIIAALLPVQVEGATSDAGLFALDNVRAHALIVAGLNVYGETNTKTSERLIMDQASGKRKQGAT